MRPANVSYSDELFEKFLARQGVTPADVPTVWTEPPKEVHPDAPSIYLDVKDWINLAKARNGRLDGAAFEECYALVHELSAAGAVRIVVSSALYMELQGAVPTARQRTHLATVIGELSRFRTLAPRSHLLESEVERALHDRLGRPMFPTKATIFGRGFSFTFNARAGALTIQGPDDGVAALRLSMGNEGFDRMLYRVNELTEYLMIRGARAEDIAEMPGYNSAPLLQMERDRVARERELAGMLDADPKLKGQLTDIVAARELYWELGPELPRLLWKAGMTVDSFFWKGKEWIADFVASLPTLAVQMTLRRQIFANAGREWKVNDLRDLDHLSTAVPYCDIVVTDKHSADALIRSKLNERLRTVILDDVSDLPDVLRRTASSIEPEEEGQP